MVFPHNLPWKREIHGKVFNLFYCIFYFKLPREKNKNRISMKEPTGENNNLRIQLSRPRDVLSSKHTQRAPI